MKYGFYIISWIDVKRLEFTLLKNLSGYNQKVDLAEKCKRALEARFEGEIPMPKSHIKRRLAKKRKNQELPRFF